MAARAPQREGGPVTLVYARYDHFDEKRAMATTLETPASSASWASMLAGRSARRRNDQTSHPDETPARRCRRSARREPAGSNVVKLAKPSAADGRTEQRCPFLAAKRTSCLGVSRSENDPKRSSTNCDWRKRGRGIHLLCDVLGAPDEAVHDRTNERFFRVMIDTGHGRAGRSAPAALLANSVRRTGAIPSAAMW